MGRGKVKRDVDGLRSRGQLKRSRGQLKGAGVNKPNLLTVRATFLQIKLCKSKLEGEMHMDIKIQVSCDMKQSTLGSSSTILHPLTEVRGQKICSSQIC